MESLPLKFINGEKLRINPSKYENTMLELEDFLSGLNHLHTKTFAKDVMFSHEIKANNQVEGYYDDLKLIKDLIERHAKDYSDNQKMRIMNLYHGYNYILREDTINKDNLKKLYSILSKDLLEQSDRDRMGDYYREDKVFIYFNGILSRYPDEGIPYTKIDEFMNSYFEFLNNEVIGSSITEEYVKSQILHFYFVYIHPYFDVNGRTSRTLAMWYLLNKKAYPYIIFNRGITFKGSEYDKTIIEVKKYKDISFFIEYMLKTVQLELEKEYIMQVIVSESHEKLTSCEWEALLYILSINGDINVSTFTSIYNRFHEKRKNKEIYNDIILPLKDKKIIKTTRLTNNYMFENYHNEEFEINSELLNYNKEKIRRLTKYR